MNSELKKMILEAGLSDIAASAGVVIETQLDEALNRIITQDPVMLKIKQQIRKVAASDLSVLIYGESGTGKEYVAQALHGNRQGKFIAVNAAAIPSELLEGELFGSKKGSYTGSTMDRIGLVEQAKDGTLFLDEIGDMPLFLQAKLLRVLQERKFRKLGDEKETAINFRLVCATNSTQLYTMRSDLYYRIAGIRFDLPSIHQRPGDIELLVKHFLKNNTELASDFLMRLQNYMKDGFRLKGNIRQLINLINQYKLLGELIID